MDKFQYEDDDLYGYERIVGSLSPSERDLLKREAEFSESMRPAFNTEDSFYAGIEDAIMQRFSSEEVARA